MAQYTIDTSTFTPAQKALVAQAAKLAAPGNTVNLTDSTNPPTIPEEEGEEVNGSTVATPSATTSNATASPLAEDSNQGVNPPAERYPTGYTASAPDTTAPAASAADQAEAAYQASATPETPEAIDTRIQGEYASEIASIEQYYNTLLAQQTTQNQQNSGATRAEESATGELGQDIGASETQEQNTANEQNLENITGEESNAVGAVESGEAQQEESEIQSEKATQLSSEQQNISYLQNEQNTTESQISTVAGAYDLASLPQDMYDSLYEASGFSTPDQFNAYYNAARTAALTGGKTIGDATTGVWQQQLNGTWTVVIPSSQTIGDPTTGVYAKNADGTYTQVIAPQTKVGSIGAEGSYIYNPSTGSVQTIGPAAPKIVTSGGILYSVNPSTNQATALTANKDGWNSTTASSDNEKAAIMSYVDSLGLDSSTQSQLISQIQSNSQAYYTALGNAAQAGFYTPTTLGATSPASATDQSAQALDDAASNAENAASDLEDQSGAAGS